MDCCSTIIHSPTSSFLAHSVSLLMRDASNRCSFQTKATLHQEHLKLVASSVAIRVVGKSSHSFVVSAFCSFPAYKLQSTTSIRLWHCSGKLVIASVVMKFTQAL